MAMTASRLIDLYLMIRATFTGPPSPTGIQLEKLRLGTTGIVSSGNQQEEQRALFGHLAYIVERKLEADERLVIFELRTPTGTTAYQREVRDGDLYVVMRENPDGTTGRIQETRAGERFLRPSAVPGFVVVEGRKPRYPTRLEVAEKLGLTFAAVKNAVRRGYLKLSEAYEDAA
jgi:hypothetical protein